MQSKACGALRAAASPSGTTSLDTTTASPLPHVNSPRSSANMMNTPSPQQQSLQQQQHQQQQEQLLQQRQRIMQLPQHQQQLLAQQQLRQASMPGLGQLHGQPQMHFSQPLGAQQYQGRQLPSGAIHHGMGQCQLNQGNKLNRHLNQFSSPMNTALFNSAQSTPNSQMISNMSAMMSSQTLLPRMQFGISGGTRNLAAANLSDQSKSASIFHVVLFKWICLPF
ncbi:PREDICTED: mediator of RNA polymerase II transcription subunit 8-like isoform X1 [Nicotiana attenuata]|uniref:mediator of RNA polymerase II transcription subunit 8-like isoform X1 n=1 Tax=Nicotiana attenuata TaxID=49451 RepID=UPI0009057C7F|nr:PREDICTED: mediator of RNA polymerase II transcription subunit 8-like isoform X1 [Nicotiana attenuata]XP_019243954.1 PREDICTED: mediator of RNA polymerase II transcription subunit 8-like isoform X1 [Nicotiana attenuata]